MNQNIISILTGTKSERFEEYLAALEVKLTEEEMDEITKTGSTYHFRVRFTSKIDEDNRS